jgi:uncharacterized coiled-coil protein SlyX
MHLSGKIFAWLLIPLLLAAMVLSAKAVKVRNSWTAKIEKLRKEYADLAPKLDDARSNLRRAQSEWHRATQTWGLYAQAQTNVTNPAGGTLTVALGTSHGIKEKQWLYGFEIQADGSAIYRGDFTATTVREGESVLQPNWRLHPGETSDWKGGTWRWRLFLPSAYPNRFDELEQTMVLQDELLADRQLTLGTQKELIESAKAQLKLREEELVGGPDLPQDPTLDAEFRMGLVPTLEDLEEARNRELIAIDRLRRSVRDLQHKIRSTQSDNLELVRKLPQPPAEITRKP